MSATKPKLHQIIRFSLGYFLFGGENDAVFNVSPAGALKLTFFFLIDYKNKASSIHDTCCFVSSNSQRGSLSSYPSPYVGFQSNIQAKQIDKLWAFFKLFIIMIKAFWLYGAYQSAKTTSTPAYNWIAKYALFCNILAGLFISQELTKNAKLKTIYISTDHCPIILSIVFNLKSSIAPEIIYRPHGGSIGWKNEFRALTRGFFSKILPLSDFQADLFKEWAETQCQIDNVIRPVPVKAFVCDQGFSKSVIANNTCLVWLNQADFFDRNLNGTVSLIKRVLSVEARLDNCIFVSKKAVPKQLKALFRRTEEFSSFSGLSKFYSIPILLKTCPSICVSSSVVTQLFAYSNFIYCSEKSPIIHDKVANHILEKKGFYFEKKYREFGDYWKIFRNAESTENLHLYFRENL